MTPLPSGKHGVGRGREGVLPPTGRAPRHGVRLPRPRPPTEGCAVWDSEPPLRGDVCFGRASSGPRGNSRPSEGVTEWPAQGGTTSLPRPPRRAVLGLGRRTRGAGASRLRVRQSGACTCHSGPAPVTHACLARSSRPLRPPLPPGTGDGRLPHRTTRLLRNGPTAAPFPSPALISCKLPVTTRLPASGVTELMGNEGKAPRACTALRKSRPEAPGHVCVLHGSPQVRSPRALRCPGKNEQPGVCRRR